MIETVAEHSFETLQPNSLILDLGCIGFEFANEMRRRGHAVFCVDIQKFEGNYDRLAITDYNGWGWIAHNKDKQATRFMKGIGVSDSVECMTLEKYSDGRFWDLIKMDIEGSERDVIYSLVKAPAKQLSIEFHLHTGVYSKVGVSAIVSKLHSLGYKTVKHDLTEAHGCGFNYWDSLFVL